MAEVKKSLRPKARPKGLGLSSTRPRSRPLSDEEGMARQEAAAVKQAQSLDQVREFGNLEFRADMDKQLKWNPLARLGFEPDQSVVARPAYNSPEMYEGMRYPYRAEQEYIDDTLSRATSGSVYADIAGRVKPGSVIVNSNTAKNPIWSHEYTHGGLEKVIEYLNEDKEYFKEKYGTNTVKLLEKIEVDTNIDKGPNEKLTEMLDDISKDADVDISGNVIPAAGTGLGTMDKTRSAVSDHEASTDRVQLRRNLEEGRVNDADMSTRVFFEQNLPGYAGIFKAAEDMLEKQGEPLPSKKKGWWEQKANKWLSGEGLFNEGGDVMNRQMEMFAVGGLSDDGMTRDPVSGNDIPPGSMAEEVRDDIPAQLSEGEYVVPADVVRFFGVRYFEDLRTEAKMGLSNMEANGRIGGEPVPSGGPMAGPTESALTPEEMAALSDMGMNVGGFVPQQQPPVQAIGNTQQGMNRGYAPGGDVVDFNPANYGLGYSVYGQPSNTTAAVTAPSTVALYSPDGVMRSLTLPAEQAEYDRLIAEGWSTEMTTETSVGKDNSDEDYLDGKGGGGNPIAEQSLESLELQLKNLQEGTGVAGFITGLIDESLLGKGIKALTGKSVLADSIARIQEEIARRAGVDGGGGTSADKGTFKPKGEGNTLAQKAAIQKSIDDYQAEAAKKKVQVTTSPASSSGGDDGDPFFEDTFTTTTDVGGHNVTERTYGDTTVGADEDGLNKGGFVSKRTKKKKK